MAATNLTTNDRPLEIASRLSILTRRLDRLTSSPARYSRGWLPAVERRIASIEETIDDLEMRILSARPGCTGDVVAQLIQVIHRVNVAIDSSPATTHDAVNRHLHRAVEIIAMEAGVNLRDAGGDDYLVYRHLAGGAK